MATIAEQKRTILPYLQRADEINTLNPKVAFYCRQYAIQQGIQIPEMLPEIKDTLIALMDKLEQDKPKLDLNKEADGQECEAFAIMVFNRADKQDRAGKATLSTVKAFYVASVFIDVLRQFDPNGELPADMAERQQYAAWKAADIRKALREGRVPQAGPPANDTDLELPDIPDLKHDGTDPNPRDVTTSASGGLPSLPSLPSGPPVSGGIPPAAGGQGSSTPQIPSHSQGSLQGRPRFGPGSRVFVDRYDGSAPVKGTVVSINPDSMYGNVYQVALAAKVVEENEKRLAFDFSEDEAVLYTPPSGQPSQGKVLKGDASRWPVAYLVALDDLSDTVATPEKNLVPAQASKAAPPPPPVQPHSPTRSLPDAAPGPSPAGGEDLAASHDLSTRDSHIAGPSHSGAEGHDDEEGIGRSDSQQSSLPPGPSGARSQDLGPDTLVQPDGNDPALPPTLGSLPPPAASQPSGTIPGAAPDANPYPVPQHNANHFGDSFGPGSIVGAQFLPPHAQSPPPPAVRGYPDLGGVPPAAGPFQPPGPPQQPSQPPAASPPPPTQHSQGILQAQMLGPDAQALPYVPALKDVTEAQKLSKHAANALSFEDIKTAKKLLQEALDLLQRPRSQ